MAESGDRELLRRWRAGDRAAGSELFRRHFTSVARFLASRAPAEAVDDLIQSTFERCAASCTRIRDGMRIRAYLLTIARNELLMHLRSRAKSETQATCDIADSVHASWLANFRAEQRLLLAALRRLPGDLQMTVELRYWEELSLEEIGLVMGTPLNTVKTRLHRARGRLAEELRALEAEAEVREATISRMEYWVASMREQRLHPAGS